MKKNKKVKPSGATAPLHVGGDVIKTVTIVNI